jgi:hypothetical protein
MELHKARREKGQQACDGRIKMSLVIHISRFDNEDFSWIH